MTRGHAGWHFAQGRKGHGPRLPPFRLTPAQQADLHHDLDRIIHGCSWCMAAHIAGLGAKAAAMSEQNRAHMHAQLLAADDQAAGAAA